MTQAGVPVYLRDIADVTDTTEDRRSFTAHQRQARRPHAGHQAVGHEHRRRSPRACARKSSAINREVPGVKLHVARRQLDVHRARRSTACRSTRMIGGVLVIADHLPVPAQLPVDAHHLHVDSDLGHRHLRAALLRRLHAEHDDLRRPGARHRHDRRRRDRRAREHVPAHGDGQGPDDGGDRRQRGSLVGDSRVDPHAHRRVRAAALPDRASRASCSASCRSSSSFSLAMSLFVAVTIVPVLCSRLLDAAAAASSERKGLGGRLYTAQRAVARTAWTTATRRMLHLALHHRPTVVRHRRRAVRRGASLMLPDASTSSSLPQTDEGEVTVDAELAVGTRIERTEAVLIGLEETIRAARARSDDADHPGRRRRRRRRLRRRRDATAATSTCAWCRATSARARTIRSRMDLRRQLSGIPGVIVRASAVGRQATR